MTISPQSHSRLKIIAVVLISFFIFLSCQNNEQPPPATAESTMPQATIEQKPFTVIKSSGNWPQFRGEFAAGIADEENVPESWDGNSGENIKWKTAIPGLAHSSPIVWGDKLFITSAISSKGEATFKHGLYGAGDASDDVSPHKWMLYCLDKRSGDILWESLAHAGVPKDKRHIKSTYANSTPATNGEYVVALFGSEGIYAFNMFGNLMWQRDLGRMNVGAYNAPHLEWGPASSPIIHDGKVYIQTDTSEEDYLLALDIQTGETVWRTERDELPGWGTPTIVKGGNRAELVTNSSNFIYGYDPNTGAELWRLGGSSQITAPTPVYSDSIIIVCSGRGPEAPVFAIKTGATGDITLPEHQTSSENILWSKTKVGPYMPTPIIYRGYVYTLNNNGDFRCYDLESGEKIYSEKIPHRGGGFSGSPVASDGHIFLASEDGDVFVIKAGPLFEIIATNDVGERIMTTPAISDGTLFIRAEKSIFAVGT
jgi:outer membrane protein assembly factor BamB